MMLKNSMDSYVVTSRVRLARNLSGCNFMSTLRHRDAETIVREVTASLERMGLHCDRLADLGDLEIEALKERHLISPALIRNRAVSAVARKDDEGISVMINEEDHLRIQCVLEGLELSRAFEAVNRLDDAIGAEFDLAYDPAWGFLTACPTNLGTGMRASVMMFLPGLHLTGGISELTNSGILSHMTFRGLYGEGSDAEGFLYQLSNRNTLGLSETEILQEVKEDIDVIALKEERARDALFEEERVTLTDRIYRAWGSLISSYAMPEKEFCSHVAFVKLGVGLGIIHLREPRILDRLTVDCRTAILADGKVMTEEESEILRAQKLREILTPMGLS